MCHAWPCRGAPRGFSLQCIREASVVLRCSLTASKKSSVPPSLLPSKKNSQALSCTLYFMSHVCPLAQPFRRPFHGYDVQLEQHIMLSFYDELVEGQLLSSALVFFPRTLDTLSRHSSKITIPVTLILCVRLLRFCPPMVLAGLDQVCYSKLGAVAFLCPAHGSCPVRVSATYFHMHSYIRRNGRDR